MVGEFSLRVERKLWGGSTASASKNTPPPTIYKNKNGLHLYIVHSKIVQK